MLILLHIEIMSYFYWTVLILVFVRAFGICRKDVAEVGQTGDLSYNFQAGLGEIMMFPGAPETPWIAEWGRRRS